ncbi:hypothetical protein MPER_05580, partial [Moniliophthora perniciosa FA553]
MLKGLKGFFTRKIQEYVKWFHSDTSNYGAAMVGVATAKSPCDDGTSYLLYASDNNQNFKISRLDDNYYNVTQQVNVISGSTLESPGIIKRNGVYYLFASHTTGWDPNPNKYFRANASSTQSVPVWPLRISCMQSLSGSWSAQADIAPPATRTYFSQN